GAFSHDAIAAGSAGRRDDPEVGRAAVRGLGHCAIMAPFPPRAAAARVHAHTSRRGPAMTALVIGLILFLGAHSVRIVADDWRSARVAAMGEGAWKGVYSLVSLAGLVLIVWGYGLSRAAPVDLWQPPV